MPDKTLINKFQPVSHNLKKRKQTKNKEYVIDTAMARDSCLARVTAGVAVGGAVGGAVGEFLCFHYSLKP